MITTSFEIVQLKEFSKIRKDFLEYLPTVVTSLVIEFSWMSSVMGVETLLD